MAPDPRFAACDCAGARPDCPRCDGEGIVEKAMPTAADLARTTIWTREQWTHALNALPAAWHNEAAVKNVGRLAATYGWTPLAAALELVGMVEGAARG